MKDVMPLLIDSLYFINNSIYLLYIFIIRMYIYFIYCVDASTGGVLNGDKVQSASIY